MDGKLLVKVCHQLHRPCQILQRGVIAQIQKGAVAQHEHGIAPVMQLVGRGAALTHLRGCGQGVAGHYDSGFGVGGLGRIIKQLHTAQTGIVFDLLRSVDLIGDLDALIIVINDKVQRSNAGFPVGVAKIIVQGLVFPAFHHQRRHLTAICIIAASLDRRVCAQLSHCSFCRDMRCTLCAKGRQRRAKHKPNHTQQYPDSFSHTSSMGDGAPPAPHSCSLIVSQTSRMSKQFLCSPLLVPRGKFCYTEIYPGVERECGQFSARRG